MGVLQCPLQSPYQTVVRVGEQKVNDGAGQAEPMVCDNYNQQSRTQHCRSAGKPLHKALRSNALHKAFFSQL